MLQTLEVLLCTSVTSEVAFGLIRLLMSIIATLYSHHLLMQQLRLRSGKAVCVQLKCVWVCVDMCEVDNLCLLFT